MTLSDDEMTALRNLAGKKAGESVGWINIARARALTLLGLAQRGRAGWDITALGLKFMSDHPPVAPMAHVFAFQRPRSMS